MSQIRKDRFEAYNAQQRKNPPVTTEYPRMLTNPETQETCIVQDEDEHRSLVGDKKFETLPFWGPSSRAAPEVVEKPPEPEKTPEVAVTEDMRARRGAKMRGLGAEEKTINELVPAQTVFTHVPPPADAS